MQSRNMNPKLHGRYMKRTQYLFSDDVTFPLSDKITACGLDALQEINR